MGAPRWISAAVIRTVFLTLVWLVLAGPDPDYAIYGAVSVAAALVMSLWLQPPVRVRADSAERGGGADASAPEGLRRRSAPGVVRQGAAGVVLVVWFLCQSVIGGADVALRAVRRQIDVDPVIERAPFLLPEGHARQLALLLMNLMPGSMVQQVIGQAATDDASGDAHGSDSSQGTQNREETVELHSLAAALRPAQQWEHLQQRVGAAFGHSTSPR